MCAYLSLIGGAIFSAGADGSAGRHAFLLRLGIGMCRRRYLGRPRAGRRRLWERRRWFPHQVSISAAASPAPLTDCERQARPAKGRIRTVLPRP
jgi:hypothetical protein